MNMVSMSPESHARQAKQLSALKALNSKAQGGGCAAAETLGNREMRNRVL
jgi:hypothetical protein